MQTLMTEQAEVLMRDILRTQAQDKARLDDLQNQLIEMDHQAEVERAKFGKTIIYLKRIHKSLDNLDQTLVS
jgi:hypothetical protein